MPSPRRVTPNRCTARRRDGGFTIPELLITVAVLGLVMTVLASTLTVLMRQESSTGGRLTNANAEQTVGMWMPTDLASAQAVDDTPSARPCATPCSSAAAGEGSNALMLSWQTMISPGSPPTMKTTNVSYRYIQRDGAWMLNRVQCDRVTGGNWTCTERIVARTMAAPPPGTTFTAGTTYPTWAVGVAQPLDPIDPGTGTTVPANESQAKNATRVTLTVHGGGTENGLGGGSKQIVLTAGSTKLINDLDPASMDGAPTFANLRSRCGGTFGLIVDASRSINATQLTGVKAGLIAFVDTFRGTPVKIQMTTFGDRGWIIGSTDGKTPRWFDMLDEADVAAFKAAVNAITTRWGTNYEEGIFRMFRNDDGSQQELLPDTALFFTDGEVYGSRLWGNRNNAGQTWTFNTASAPLDPPGPSGFGVNTANDAQFRAEYWAGLYRDVTTRFIGVGVGKVANNENFVRSIAKIVSGTTTGVPATTDASGAYNNAETANLYVLPEWEQFTDALEAVALAKCGGTLTVQTLENGEPFSFPVSYQNTGATLASGQPAQINLTTATTSTAYPSATFDYDIASGGYLTVDIMPASLADLDGFAPVGWSCSARGVARDVTVLPITGSQFTGIRVKVNVNEALSCRLTVKDA